MHPSFPLGNEKHDTVTLLSAFHSSVVKVLLNRLPAYLRPLSLSRDSSRIVSPFLVNVKDEFFRPVTLTGGLYAFLRGNVGYYLTESQ